MSNGGPATDAHEQIAEGYRRFAREAVGRSPLYVEFARAVAASPWVLDFLAPMPETKWQPNVLLGVVRHLYGTPARGEEFVRVVERNADQIAEVMAVRSTQTNDPARCVTLFPVLARVPQPLALLEVGAAAGLCLLPDYYAYDSGGGHLVESTATCGRAGAANPLPGRARDAT